MLSLLDEKRCYMDEYGLKFYPHFMASPKLVQKAISLIQIWKEHISEPIYTIFDIGANVGVYSCVFAKMFPNAKIYAWEPIPENFQHLTDNINLNQLNLTCDASPEAVWHKTVVLNLSIPSNKNKKNTGTYTVYGDGEQISCLAVALKDLDLPVPDLIKMDIEGSESAAIRGLGDILPQVAYIIVEKNTRNRNKNFPDYHVVEDLLSPYFDCVYHNFDEIWKNKNENITNKSNT